MIASIAIMENIIDMENEEKNRMKEWRKEGEHYYCNFRLTCDVDIAHMFQMRLSQGNSSLR